MNLSSRNLQIDFMRGIAILLVLFHHFSLTYHLSESALNKVFSSDFIKATLNNGNYGVTMFFVISGFLITSTTIERYKTLGKIDLIGFYIFRFARIMPCLLLAIFLITLFNFCHIKIFTNNSDSSSFFIGILSVLTFWHNVLMEKAGWFNYCLNTFWSLSVEEVFYLTFPIACLLFKKMRFIIPVWLAFILIAPIYRSYYSENEILAVYGYLSCFDAIAMGCCAAIITKKIQLSDRVKTLLQYSASILLISTYFYSGIMENIAFGFSLIAISTSILLISSLTKPTHQNHSIVGKSICWFGKNSYEFYLFHIIVLAFMKAYYKPDLFGDYSKLAWLLVFLGISALVAGSIERYYSQPLNKKLRKFLFQFRQQKPELSAIAATRI